MATATDEITIASTTETQEALDAALGLEPKPTEVTEGDEPDAEAQAQSAADAAAAGVKGTEKRNRVQERIDQLTAERNIEKGKVQVLTDQLQELRERIEAGAVTEEEAEETAAEIVAEEPKPTVAEVGDGKKYATYEDFVEALSDWKAKKAVREALAQQVTKTTQTEQAQQAQQAWDGWVERREAFKTEMPDWDEVIASAPKVEQPAAIGVALVESEVGPQIAYYLAKHPDEYQAILKMKSPIKMSMAMGKLEDKILAERALKAPAKPAPKAEVSKAPAPITPVGARSVQTATKKPEDMNMQEFKAWRKATGRVH